MFDFSPEFVGTAFVEEIRIVVEGRGDVASTERGGRALVGHD